MSAYSPQELAGLGDHMKVGPQYQVPTNRAVTLVQRGPHGQSLFPPTRYGGNGIGWWNEQAQPTPWTPKQKVVSLLGMGGSQREASRAEKVRLTNTSKDLQRKTQDVERLASSNKRKVATAFSVAQHARTAIAELEKLQMWNADWSVLPPASWDGSQTIRGRLVWSLQRSKHAMGVQTTVKPGGYSAPDEYDDTFKDSQAEIGKRARDMAAQAGKAAGQAGSAFDSVTSALKTNPLLAVAVTGAVLVLMAGASGFGKGIGIR
jgi:hypothetical protein